MSSSNPRKSSLRGGTALRPRFENRGRALREVAERKQAAAAAAASAAQEASKANPSTASISTANKSAAAVAPPARQQCPNKACPKPNVIDGTCRTCGRVADDSNIVAEVQFGETSSGAAVVQGSFIGADQAGVRSMGPAFRRVGASEDREKSIREARGLMQGYAQQLSISESMVTSGTQVFKLASGANFIQGRTLASVAAVCLYAACRAEPPCKVMLIDLADLVQLNVFKLGRIFKKLNEVVPIGNDGLIPVYPEDLIWRFATKMEFHQETAKVAEDAVRLVKRMSRDWMVMGRRPSGICGACLLMAARMHNFRRTVREVVYIVKVTNHTIQNRLAEFKFTESSRMSVEDFLKQDFLESSHDPPSFYRKSEEFRKSSESRGKKRLASEAVDDEEEGDEDNSTSGEAEAPEPKRQKAATEVGADLTDAPPIKFRRDQDGFIIPPLPSQIAQDQPQTEPEVEAGSDTLDQLAQEFGDAIDEGADQPTTPKKGRGRSNPKPTLPINEAWEQDENELEGQIEEIFNDPLTYEHTLAYANATQRARIHSSWALQQRPIRDISMSVDIGEDEFADDPEVRNCLLSPEEARIKETIWVNQNKEWLRKHQEKVFRRKVEAERPKQTRRRKKRARMGEGQTSPASSAAEAAIGVAKDRAWSRRINYDAIRNIFDIAGDSGGGGGLSSATTSIKGSEPGSVLGDDDDDEEPDETVAGDNNEKQTNTNKTNNNSNDNDNEEEEVDDEEEEEEYEEREEYGGGGGGEFEGGYEDDDNPDMDGEYGLEGDDGGEEFA